MIVFKKAAEQQLQASIDILQSKLVLRTLKKSAAGQNFRRAAWPRLFTSAEAVHEQIPVFFPDDTPTPFTYTAKNGRRREVSSVGGGVYHIFSPDRFDAQSFMSYLMHIAASNNELKPLLAYDTETSGLNTTRTTIDGQPPSVPWEVGWHAGAGVTSHLLRLPADAVVPADAAFGVGQRNGGGYYFHNTPVDHLTGKDDELKNQLETGTHDKAKYEVSDTPSGKVVTHKKFLQSGVKTYSEIFPTLLDLTRNHTIASYNAPFDARMLHSLAETLADNGSTEASPESFKEVKMVDIMRPYARIAGMLSAMTPSSATNINRAYFNVALPRENPTISHDAGGDAEILWGLMNHLASVPPDIWRQRDASLSDGRAAKVRALWGAVRFGSHFAETNYPIASQATPIEGEFRKRVDLEHPYLEKMIDGFYGDADHYHDGLRQFIEHQLRRDPSMHYPLEQVQHSNGSHTAIFSLDNEAISSDFDPANGQTRWPIGTSRNIGQIYPDAAHYSLPSKTTAQIYGIIPSLDNTHRWGQNNGVFSLVIPPAPEASIDSMGYRPIRSLATLAHLFMQTRPMVLKNGKVTLIPVHEVTRDHHFLAYPRPNGLSDQWIHAANHSKEIHAALTSYIAAHHPELQTSDVDKDLWKVSDNHAADALTITPDLIPTTTKAGGVLTHPADTFFAPHLLGSLHAIGGTDFAVGATNHLMSVGLITHPSDRSPTTPSP